MGYAAVQFDSYDSDNFNYCPEDKEFFVVCVDIDGELCKYVTAAPSRMDAIENVERELELTADPSWNVFGPMMIC